MFTETPHRTRLLGSKLVALLTGPHGVDRYTELVDPTWTIHEARAEVASVNRTTPRSVTLELRPNRAFTGFEAGQHISLSLDIDGRRHTRCYSPASSEHASELQLEITVGLHEGGKVSTYLRDHARPGMVVNLGAAGGEFVLPQRRPPRLVLISGGSGITPVMSMLRTLVDERYEGQVAFLHYARNATEATYADELDAIAAKHPNITVLHGYTRTKTGDVRGRFSTEHLPFVAEHTYVCGPPSLVDAVRATSENAQSECFVPPVFVIPDTPSGGEIVFTKSAVNTIDDGRSLLEQAEAAGLRPEHGCRMGICHSCTCRKTRGAVRNLITGAVSTADEEDVQICISAPVGNVELAL
jgi:ferredoxin-NADP reductase